MLANKLQIVLITYNRKEYLKETLSEILADNSPIKNFDITILDNHSTDGTSELIDEYCDKYKNLTHVINKKNIGGNPNIAKALTEYSDKKYIWVLCDNDKYCWKYWDEIENAINEDFDVIFTRKVKNEPADIFYQAAFLPACIYKTDNIDETVIENMYDNIKYLFPHLAIIAKNINHKKRIWITSNETVILQANPENEKSFTRGNTYFDIPQDRRNILWAVGYLHSTELISDKKTRTDIIEGTRHYNKSLFEFFKTFMVENKYYRNNYRRNFTQIFRLLNFSQKIRFVLAYMVINFSWKNYRFYEMKNKEDWSEYLNLIKEKKYIEKLSEKLKGKKIILYGAGIVAEILTKEYDLSELNIVGISDKKFEREDTESCFGYKTIKPDDLKNTDFDCILFTMKLYKKIEDALNKNGIYQQKLPLIKKDNHYILRTK